MPTPAPEARLQVRGRAVLYGGVHRTRPSACPKPKKVRMPRAIRLKPTSQMMLFNIRKGLIPGMEAGALLREGRVRLHR